MKAAIFSFLIIAGAGLASEAIQFPLEVGTFKAGIRTYEGAKIVGADAVGVKVNHDGGTARVKYEHLPENLRVKFNFNREAAKEQVRLEAEASESYHQQATEAEAMAEKIRQARSFDEQGRPKRSKMELQMDSQRATELQNYIIHLRSNIIKTEANIKKQRLRAQQSMYRSFARGGYYSRSGFRGVSRTIGAEIRTLPQQEKIAQAKMQIEEAERQIMELETKR